MKKTLLLFLLIVFTFNSKAQELFSEVLYDHSDALFAHEVIPDNGNGFIVIGKYSNGGLIMHLDSVGNCIWKKTFNQGTGVEFNCVTATSDSCFIAAGEICVKVNNLGDTVWSKQFNATIFSVHESSDGGIILCGTYSHSGPPYSTCVAIKLFSDGSLNWEKHISSFNFYNEGYDLEETPDGGFLLTGFGENSSPFTNYATLIKLDNSGNITWAKDYLNQWGVDLYISNSSIYTLMGDSNFLTMMKTDLNGNVIWGKWLCIGFSNSLSTQHEQLHKLSDQNFAIAISDTYFKIDTNGNILWSERPMMFPVVGMTETKDTGFIILGDGPLYAIHAPLDPGTNPQIAVMKTDSLGIGAACDWGSGGLTSSSTSFVTAVITPISSNVNTEITIYPAITIPNISIDSGCVNIVGVPEYNLEGSISIAPNPFNDQTTIYFSEKQKNSSVKIIDVLGKEIFTGFISDETENYVIYKNKLKEGIYFVDIQTEKGRINKKIIIQ